MRGNRRDRFPSFSRAARRQRHWQVRRLCHYRQLWKWGLRRWKLIWDAFVFIQSTASGGTGSNPAISTCAALAGAHPNAVWRANSGVSRASLAVEPPRSGILGTLAGYGGKWVFRRRLRRQENCLCRATASQVFGPSPASEKQATALATFGMHALSNRRKADKRTLNAETNFIFTPI